MIKFIFKYLEGYKAEFLLIIFCAGMTAAADLAMPYLTAKFIDEVLATRNFEGLYFFMAVLLAINILVVLSNWFFVIRSTILRAKLTKNLAENLMCRVQKLESRILFETDMIYLSKRINKDSDDLTAFVLGSTIDISIQGALLLTAIFLLQSTGLKWLIILLTVAAIHAGIFGALRKKLFAYSTAVRETESRFFTSFADNFLYVNSIKLHSLQEEFLAAFRKSFERFFDASINEAKIRFWFSYGRANETKIFTVLIFFWGGLDVLSGKIYCIVEKNGGGKTTLLNLICGIIKPARGEIFYDGILIGEIDMIDARKNLIAVVEQKEFLKNDTLSGGERRGVSLEKTFSKNADLIILDESDNNLDGAALKSLIEKISANKQTCITILISHEEKIIGIADEIIKVA